MKTFLNEDIAETTLAILYLCQYNYEDKTILVCRAIQFDNEFDALQAYANIPNPESQMASGNNKESFERELWKLHQQLEHPEWVKELANYL